MTEASGETVSRLDMIPKAFAAQGFMKLVGAELDEVGEGFVQVSVAYRPELTQQHGFYHGGVIAFLADNATTAAAGTVARPDQSVLTVEYKLNFVSPAVGERVYCRAEVVKPGRMLTVVEAKVYAVKDGKEKLVATALATIANVDARPMQETGS